MVKSERKQREFARREQEIIDVAHELFRAGDIQAVTIEQIAEAADIGKGTVYKHFRSKDEIYARIISRLNRALRAEIATIDKTLPFRQRLDRIIDLIWQHNMQDIPFLYRLNLHVMSGDFKKNLGEEVLKEMMALQEEENAFYLQLLAEAQQQGEILAAPLEELLFGTSAAIDGAILRYWMLHEAGAVRPEEGKRFLRQIQDFVHRALQPELA